MDSETKDLIGKIEEVLHFMRALESDFKAFYKGPQHDKDCSSYGHSLICGMKELTQDESYYELRDSLAAWKLKHVRPIKTVEEEK